MIYAQFFHRAVNSTKLIEACGDRSVIILDGRESKSTHTAIARAECRKRGYLAFQLCAGASFTRSRATSAIVEVAQ